MSRRRLPAGLDGIDKFTRLLEVAATPGGITALSRCRPFSVAAFRLVHGLLEDGLSFATIIDVGANVGKFSRAAIAVWPDADVIAFEPLPQAAQGFRAQRSLAGHTELHPIGLGARDGTMLFYPHAYDLSSSPLPVPDLLQQKYKWARELPPIEVPVRRLDGILGSRPLRRPVLLKLDVQGFEIQVLNGAPQTLRATSALVIEQAFDEIYSGQPLFNESHAFLAKAGWRLARVLDWRREAGRVAEVDCLYVPVDPGHDPSH